MNQHLNNWPSTVCMQKNRKLLKPNVFFFNQRLKIITNIVHTEERESKKIKHFDFDFR